MMHPRNIYNKLADFDQLRIQFPEFAAKVHIDINGRVKLDFKDSESVRILSQCCLKKDFDLNVELPPDRLLPTLPLRLNYILWIEDILKHCAIDEEVAGVDIGTGASSIYCLLALRMNPQWKMFALEIDRDNVRYARENIIRNQLEEHITLIDQENSEKIFEKLFANDPAKKTFTICNPPFFSSPNELTAGENRSGNRKRPHSSYMQASSETVFQQGGELGFVNKILEESVELKDKIDIYSSMFGCKKNYQSFICILKNHKIDNFTTTEFVQGKVVRWGVAWSFVGSYDLRNFRDHSKTNELKARGDKKSNVLTHTLENHECSSVRDRILEIFSHLKISTKLFKEEEANCYNYELEAHENTWSNQRRKRRAQAKSEEGDAMAVDNASQQNLHMGFEIRKNDESTIMKIFYISGTMSRDCVNQILQHIKNHFKSLNKDA